MTIAQPGPPAAPTGAEGGEFIDTPGNRPGSEDPGPAPVPEAPSDAAHAPRWLARALARLEDREDLDGAAASLGRLTPLVSRGRWGSFLRGEWLGHALHPVLTDLPLGCWLGVNVLDLVGGPGARPAARRLTGAGLLAVPFTALSGLADWAANDDPRVGRVGTIHAAGNVVVAGAYFASWRARAAEHHAQAVTWALAGGALAVVTGYLGGHMSFGRGVGVAPRGLG